MWGISRLALWKFKVGCIKNLSWPAVRYAGRLCWHLSILRYAHRSWTELSMFRVDADRVLDVSRNAIHAPRLSRAQARVNLLPSKSCGLRPTGFGNGSQEERKRWPRLSLVTNEPREVRKRVKHQKPKLISPFLSPEPERRNMDELFSGVRNRCFWRLAFGDTSTKLFLLGFFLRYFCEGWLDRLYWSDHLLPHGVCQDTAAATVQSKSCDLDSLEASQVIKIYQVPPNIHEDPYLFECWQWAIRRWFWYR